MGQILHGRWRALAVLTGTGRPDQRFPIKGELMRRSVFVLAVMVAMGVFAAGAYAAGGNSDAAHACQQSGYLNLHRSDGTSFKNSGDCVSYFAQSGTPSTACVVTATTGCLTFDNVTLAGVGSATGSTVSVSAAYSFNSTCNDSDLAILCPSLGDTNNYATGGGTYVITDDATGATVEQGTLVTADTAGAGFEGLAVASYTAADGTTPTTCSAADYPEIAVYASTGVASDPTALLSINVNPFSPTNANGTAVFSTSLNAYDFQGPLTGVKLAC